jgi:hypothetical protein
MSRVVAFEFQRFALKSHMENLEAHCFLPEKQSAEMVVLAQLLCVHRSDDSSRRPLSSGCAVINYA